MAEAIKLFSSDFTCPRLFKGMEKVCFNKSKITANKYSKIDSKGFYSKNFFTSVINSV
jgi:hypothetical protein